MTQDKARRAYRMTDRAKAHDETRARIIGATMALHDEQGVAATSVVDVAKRAGVGAATVYRHFPTLGALVNACGSHVWQEMQPPLPQTAPEVFRGLVSPEDKLNKLVGELDAFYRRGALRLAKAHADRHLVVELDEFLQAVDRGVTALVDEALQGQELTPVARELAMSLTDFAVWSALQRVNCPEAERRDHHVRLILCAVRGG